MTEENPRPKRVWLRRALAMTISLVLSVVAIEVGYRVVLFGSAGLSFTALNSIHPMGESGLLCASSEPEIAFELCPNTEELFKLATVRTNSRGMRDEEHLLEKALGEVRIAVLGDSFTMPAGVEIEAAYHQVLEQLLAQDEPDTTFTCLNFGVGGYALRQYVAVLRHRALAYDPDLVLVGFCTQNDHRVPPESLFHKTYEPRERSYPARRSFLVRQLERAQRKSATREQVFSPREAAYLERYFGELSLLSKSADVPVVVLGLSHLPDDEYMVELEARVLAAGLRFLDLSGPFVDAVPGEYWIYSIDKHPNAKAHAIFAEGIARYLKAEGLLEE